MANWPKAQVSLLEATPSFATLKAVVSEFLKHDSAAIVSTSAPTLALARDIVLESSEDGGASPEVVGEIRSLGDLVGMFANCADLPIRRAVGRDHQAAIAALISADLVEGSPFAKAKSLRGFHLAFADAASELRYACVEPNVLKGLEGKPSHFADMVSKFESSLDHNRLTTLSLAMMRVIESPPVRPSGLGVVYWVGERQWPELFLRFASWMAASGIAVVLVCEKHGEDAEFFPETVKLREQFSSSARAGHSDPVRATQSARPTQIRIARTADVTMETEWALRHAVYANRNGTPWSRICILCRALDEYGPLLEVAATRFGVDLEISRPEPLLANGFARHLMAVLDCVADPFARGVADLFQSPYWRLSRESRAGASQAANALRRSSNFWHAASESPPTELPLSFRNVLRWRKSNQDRALTLSGWVHELSHLLAEVDWLDMGSDGDSFAATRDAAARHELVNSLFVHALKMPPGTKLSCVEFVRAAREAWRDATYRVHRFGDLRVVSDVHQVGNCEFLIALGMVDGRFPHRRVENPILLDEARRKIPDQPLRSSYEVAEEERREFYRLLCAADAIDFFWPAQVGDRINIRSVFLEEMVSSDPDVQQIEYPVERRFPDTTHAVTQAEAIAAAEWRKFSGKDPLKLDEELEAAAATLKSFTQNSSDTAIRSPNVRNLLGELPPRLTLSHLQLLRYCPFQYFARAKLGLSGEDAAWTTDLIYKAIRNVDLTSAESAEDLERRLLGALDLILEQHGAQFENHTLEVIRVSGPKLLRSFAIREMNARHLWQLQAVGQNLSLHDFAAQGGANFRTAIPMGDRQVSVDERIDVLYSRDGSLVPLRFGYFSGSDPDERFRFSAGTLLLLLPRDQADAAACFDNPQFQRRKLLIRPNRGSAKRVEQHHDKGLYADTGSGEDEHHGQETFRRFAERYANEVKNLIRVAMTGDPVPTPGEHCTRCNLGPFCRRSEFSNPYILALDSSPP